MWGFCSQGGGLRRWVLVFIMSVSLVKEWEMSTLCICQRHVSISYSGHRLQRGGEGNGWFSLVANVLAIS